MEKNPSSPHFSFPLDEVISEDKEPQDDVWKDDNLPPTTTIPHSMQKIQKATIYSQIKAHEKNQVSEVAVEKVVEYEVKEETEIQPSKMNVPLKNIMEDSSLYMLHSQTYSPSSVASEILKCLTPATPPKSSLRNLTGQDSQSQDRSKTSIPFSPEVEYQPASAFSSTSIEYDISLENSDPESPSKINSGQQNSMVISDGQPKDDTGHSRPTTTKFTKEDLFSFVVEKQVHCLKTRVLDKLHVKPEYRLVDMDEAIQGVTVDAGKLQTVFECLVDHVRELELKLMIQRDYSNELKTKLELETTSGAKKEAQVKMFENKYQDALRDLEDLKRKTKYPTETEEQSQQLSDKYNELKVQNGYLNSKIVKLSDQLMTVKLAKRYQEKELEQYRLIRMNQDHFILPQLASPYNLRAMRQLPTILGTGRAITSRRSLFSTNKDSGS